MSERGERLHAIAAAQVTELLAVLATVDDATLRRPCPGREKLGDGTVGACARHTAGNYQRIDAFVRTGGRISAANERGRRGAQHAAPRTDVGALVKQLSASRDGLGRIAALSDVQLDAVPPQDSFRFCDGQRTLAQVLTSLLKHQRHQVDALKAIA